MNGPERDEDKDEADWPSVRAGLNRRSEAASRLPRLRCGRSDPWLARRSGR
ncbi:hypothetical protein Srot_0807 [Segniliparus rotundus DSM 44985]|uniref:Uncharacterized protein n=1 Tax=Segniliparus rotundus (strain ATCC BAA-972 / CDC 1076 / CIP 108378 / DSM 44985 / JCM 13578) TaxID=640132 RepID=D6ZE06_SEGRD|nr:hypothetical protein [Segniliparus rotundus]ADG97286.1 hypothetical protein Srot_0807 [Segniliparus rotundus DSM 44985]